MFWTQKHQIFRHEFQIRGSIFPESEIQMSWLETTDVRIIYNVVFEASNHRGIYSIVAFVVHWHLTLSRCVFWFKTRDKVLVKRDDGWTSALCRSWCFYCLFSVVMVKLIQFSLRWLQSILNILPSTISETLHYLLPRNLAMTSQPTQSSDSESSKAPIGTLPTLALFIALVSSVCTIVQIALSWPLLLLSWCALQFVFLVLTIEVLKQPPAAPITWIGKTFAIIFMGVGLYFSLAGDLGLKLTGTVVQLMGAALSVDSDSAVKLESLVETTQIPQGPRSIRSQTSTNRNIIPNVQVPNLKVDLQRSPQPLSTRTNVKLQQEATSRLCTVCLENKLIFAFPRRPTSRCRHPSLICGESIEEWIVSELSSTAWDQIKCPEPSCGEIFQYEDMKKCASTPTFARFVLFLSIVHHSQGNLIKHISDTKQYSSAPPSPRCPISAGV